MLAAPGPARRRADAGVLAVPSEGRRRAPPALAVQRRNVQGGCLLCALSTPIDVSVGGPEYTSGRSALQRCPLCASGARSAPSRCVHFSLDHPRQVTIDQDEEMDPDFCYVGATRLCHDTCLCGSRLSRSVPMKYMRNVMHAAMKSSWLCPCPDIRLIRLETRGA
jgi:hypothetical protein